MMDLSGVGFAIGVFYTVGLWIALMFQGYVDSSAALFRRRRVGERGITYLLRGLAHFSVTGGWGWALVLKGILSALRWLWTPKEVGG